MGKDNWIWKIVPGFIVFVLWLNGWFFPLILLPILYVRLFEKRGLHWLGFTKHELRFSIIVGAMIALVLIGAYYPIFLHYYSDIVKGEPLTLYGVFLDVVWYPVYEETAYRSFTLAHFANPDESCLSKRNLVVNATQSLLFLSLHKHHFPLPLVLVPVFFLAFLNGMLFLRTRNIYGCIASHSVLNGFAVFQRCLYR